MPVYIWDTSDGNNFYGFPYQPGCEGIKVGAVHKYYFGYVLELHVGCVDEGGYSQHRRSAISQVDLYPTDNR
jgi:hypothetical protein